MTDIDTDKLKRLAEGLRPFVGRVGTIRIDTDEVELILALIAENERLKRKLEEVGNGD